MTNSAQTVGSPRATVVVLATTLTACLGIVAIRFGAPPHPIDPSEASGYFHELGLALVEPRDRLWLIVHALGLVCGLGGVVVASHRPTGAGRPMILATKTAALVLCLLLFPSLARVIPTEPLISGFGWRLIPATVCAIIVVAVRNRLVARPRLGRVLAVIAIATVLLGVAQTPSNSIDTKHLLDTSDEIASLATNRWYGSDYIGQYSLLTPWLGLAIRPILRIWPVESVLYLTVALSLLSVVILLTIIYLVTPRRWRPWALLLAAPWPVLAAGGRGDGERASAYLQSGSARPLLPLLICLLLIRQLQRNGSDRMQAYMLGVIAGACSLNNLEFGVPAVAALCVALAAARILGPSTPVSPSVTMLVLGVTTSLMTMAVIYQVASPAGIDLELLTAMARIHGQFGWLAIPMPVYGLHTAAGALFVSSALLGAARLSEYQGDLEGRARCVALLYAGSWSTFCLPYFASRSLVANLLLGYAFNIALCLALLTVELSRRDEPQSRSNRLTTPVVVALTAASFGAWSLVPHPLASIQRLWKPGRDDTYNLSSTVALKERSEFLRRSAGTGRDRVAAIATTGSLLELSTGVRNATLFSNDYWIAMGDYWTALQCDHLATTGLDIVLVEDPAVAEALVDNAECAEALDQSSARLLDTGWTAIDLRPGGG